MIDDEDFVVGAPSIIGMPVLAQSTSDILKRLMALDRKFAYLDYMYDSEPTEERRASRDACLFELRDYAARLNSKLARL